LIIVNDLWDLISVSASYVKLGFYYIDGLLF